MKLGADNRRDRFKLGSNFLFEVFFEFYDWGDDEGLHILIDGGNIDTDLSHFLLGLCEIRVQGSEASFQVLSTSMGNDEKGIEMG